MCPYIYLKLLPCINSFCWLCLVLLFPQSKAENLVFCFNVQGSGIKWRVLMGEHNVLFIFYDLWKRKSEELAISLCLKRIYFWRQNYGVILQHSFWRLFPVLCVAKIKEVLNAKWCELKILYLFKGREFRMYLVESLRTWRCEYQCFSFWKS